MVSHNAADRVACVHAIPDGNDALNGEWSFRRGCHRYQADGEGGVGGLDPIGVFIAGFAYSDQLVLEWQPEVEMSFLVCPDPSGIRDPHRGFDIDEGISEGRSGFIIEYRAFNMTAVLEDGRMVGDIEFVD